MQTLMLDLAFTIALFLKCHLEDMASINTMESVDCFIAFCSDKWRAVVSAVMKVRIP